MSVVPTFINILPSFLTLTKKLRESYILKHPEASVWKEAIGFEIC